MGSGGSGGGKRVRGGNVSPSMFTFAEDLVLVRVIGGLAEITGTNYYSLFIYLRLSRHRSGILNASFAHAVS